VASIDARDNQEAHLIDEISLQEGPVDVAASAALNGTKVKSSNSLCEIISLIFAGK
jgi:hypothetical protein